jgi:transcription elongation factor GreA
MPILIKNEVALGKAVVFQEVGDDEEEEYEIVGTAEADPFSGKISNESPIAQALIGRKVGDVVKIPLPMGEIEVKIVDVK